MDASSSHVIMKLETISQQIGKLTQQLAELTDRLPKQQKPIDPGKSALADPPIPPSPAKLITDPTASEPTKEHHSIMDLFHHQKGE